MGWVYISRYVGWFSLRIVFAGGASEVVGLCMYVCMGFWGEKGGQCL